MSAVFGELLFGEGVFGSIEGDAPPFETPALLVEFSIWELGGIPLQVQFDIIGLGPTVFTPLLVEFDIIMLIGPPLEVTFDIISQSMLNSRLTSDIQGPVAEVTLS